MQMFAQSMPKLNTLEFQIIPKTISWKKPD